MKPTTSIWVFLKLWNNRERDSQRFNILKVCGSQSRSASGATCSFRTTVLSILADTVLSTFQPSIPVPRPIPVSHGVTWTHHWSSPPRNTYSPVCSRWTTPHRAPPQRIAAHGIGWQRELVISYLKLTFKGRNINSYPRFWLKSPTWDVDQTRVKALCLYDSICLCENLALALCNDVKAMWSQVAVHHQHWKKKHMVPRLGFLFIIIPSPNPPPASSTKWTSLRQGAQMAMRGLGTSAKITTKITAPQMARFLTDRGEVFHRKAFRKNLGGEEWLWILENTTISNRNIDTYSIL